MTSHIVPHSVYDSLVAIVALNKQHAAIDQEREDFADVCIKSIRTIQEVAELTDLAAAIEGFKIAYGKGWSKRLKAAGLPDLAAVQRAILGVHNDGPGRWRGRFPVNPDDPRPPRGTWVVYQLLAGDDLLYIGSSGDLVVRLKAHSRDKEFDGWRAAECPTEQSCRDLETALIDRYRPPMNRVIPKPRVELVGAGA